MPVDLGFIEKCESWRLESRFFPSKVGGQPAWLDLKNIPRESDVTCKYCGEPCIFLCQIYAPHEDVEAAFHRTIYIFVCKKAECCRPNENGNLKVFRSQLSRVNDFYPSEPPIEESDWRTDISASKWVKVCSVCGISAPNHCAKCKMTNYCSRAHQVYDWKNGHKDTCGLSKESCRKMLFPEHEIDVEAEENSNGDATDENNSDQEEEELEKYKKLTEHGKAGTFQDADVHNELTNMATCEEDEAFSQFRTQIDKYPDQVLRYNKGGEILYISSENKVDIIPKCLECNEERQFEFQIMPQLLNFLGLGNALNSIDWGILAIFTCAKSCVIKNKYCVEYIWKQDIVEDKPSTDPVVSNS